ncbi:MAG: CPBP family intramembrane metalloprotease [Myxococcales bacterium]|nr:CPBP family intramembrane metalloprotease [Myxococcales bacterium]
MPSSTELSPTEPKGFFARAKAYFSTRVDPLTSLFLVLPMFVIYQIGTLVMMDCRGGMCSWRANGVDFLTGNLLALTGGSRLVYAGVALVASLALFGGVLWARRRSKLSPRLFAPVLIESAVLASIVGPTSILLSRAVGLGAQGMGSWLGDVVTSCGAGLHEELVFRAGMFTGLAWLLERAGQKRWQALLVSGALSSLAFSMIHHVGPLGEPFTLRAFVFRVFMGGLFAVIYRVRGFAIAAWTHCIYDVWVFTLR